MRIEKLSSDVTQHAYLSVAFGGRTQLIINCSHSHYNKIIPCPSNFSRFKCIFSIRWLSLIKSLAYRVSRLIRLIYQRESIFPGLLSSNDADTMSTELHSTYTQPRWWWRLSCRYLCYAARNPPSDDSQRHKSLVSHLSGTFSISLFHLPSPPFLFVSRSPTALFLLSSSPFFDFSSDPLSNQVLQALALIFPLPGYSFLSFHGHGGVSQEHRSEHNIDPAQPPPTITTTSRHCTVVGSSPWTEGRVRVPAGNLWML